MLPFQTFEIISSILICLFGTIGNSLVVLVVYRQRKMKTVTNYFIVNLAIADLAVLLINVPLDVALTLSADNKWLYGDFLCHIIYPLQTMATSASVWSLVAIGISRYVAIVHPLKPQLRRTHARWMIPAVWAISLVLVAPFMASLRMIEGVCVEDFEAAGMNTAYYTLGLFLAQYVVPLVIIAFAYLRVGQALTKNPNHDERTRNHYKETRKVIRMLKIVVFVFAVLILPLHVIYLWRDFFNGRSFRYYKEIATVTTVLLYGNSFTNPIIYNACHEEFRTCFRGYMRASIRPCARILFGQRYTGDGHVILDVGRTQSHRTTAVRRDTISSHQTNHEKIDQNGGLCPNNNGYISYNTVLNRSPSPTQDYPIQMISMI